MTLEELAEKAVRWESKYKNYRALFGTCKQTTNAKKMADFWRKELVKAQKQEINK